MKLRRRHLILAAAPVVALLLLCVQTSPLNFAEHQRFDDQLDVLQRLDTKLNQDILEIRAGQEKDYDGPTEKVEGLRQAIERLRDVPSFISRPGSAKVAGELRELSILLSRKEQLLESFESRHAVLANSMRYLPVGIRKLRGRLLEEKFNPELDARLDALFEHALSFCVNPEKEESPVAEQALESVQAWTKQNPQHREAQAIEALMAHVRSILQLRPEIEQLTASLLAVSTTAKIDGLANLYAEEFDRALVRGTRAGMFWRVGCALLLLGLGYMMYVIDSAKRTLEQRVSERTSALQEEIAERKQAEARLEEVHRQLLDTSRAAGMAEVATNVLHNVGNALNSVNVSATVITEVVKKSNVGDLGRVVALLEQNAAKLGEFVSQDKRGKNLPVFLHQLSVQLNAERTRALGELETLRESISHVKEIVAMQQTYAKVSGVTEVLAVADLLEDSVRMNAFALTQNEVKLERDYEEVPPISVEKHKVLQILVNLIQNAKNACEEGAGKEKRVTLRVRKAAGSVRISVSDNGIGFPPENLVRLFSHGFTTRKKGHGFGLHSGALAAKSLGGSLQAQSDGTGLGATFTLELPLPEARA